MKSHIGPTLQPLRLYSNNLSLGSFNNFVSSLLAEIIEEYFMTGKIKIQYSPYCTRYLFYF